VDGLRLDAVPYLYERQGTSCENLPATHAFLKKLREHVDSRCGDNKEQNKDGFAMRRKWFCRTHRV
jgi:glycosidase